MTRMSIYKEVIMKNLKKGFFTLIIFSTFSNCFFAQEVVSFSYNGGANYTMVERTDLRRYDNNKYKGLMSREVKSCISGKDGIYEGSFYVDEMVKHQNINVEPSIYNAVPSTFKIDTNGKLEMLEDCGYPSFRSFPAYPSESVKIGDSWTATAERSVDPLNKGIPTKFKMEVLYTYKGDEIFHDEEVYVFSAQWATRYGIANKDPDGDEELKAANGSHNATMYISKQTGYAIVIRDYGEDTFLYSDGNSYTFKGGISLFTEYAPVLDSEKIQPVIQKVSITMGDSIGFEETSAGFKMTMKNLQFKSNSAELLYGEEERLNQIAEILKQAGDYTFLIEGHTASTGQPNSEMQLSIERANTIARELIKRGISADRFICQGRGSSRPVADNSTPEGKAANRRVEITIFSK